jgi:hypothetical protein
MTPLKERTAEESHRRNPIEANRNDWEIAGVARPKLKWRVMTNTEQEIEEELEQAHLHLVQSLTKVGTDDGIYILRSSLPTEDE